MSAAPALAGKAFGRWTAISSKMLDRGCGTRTYWLCACTCGTRRLVRQSRLVGNETASCGCARVELMRVKITRHGHAKAKDKSPTFNSWRGMIDRCTNPRASHFHRYGGRGIKVCARWLKFENFLADMGARPDGMTLDRFPNAEGDYEPGNCRWASAKQQSANKSMARATDAARDAQFIPTSQQIVNALAHYFRVGAERAARWVNLLETA